MRIDLPVWVKSRLMLPRNMLHMLQYATQYTNAMPTIYHMLCHMPYNIHTIFYTIFTRTSTHNSFSSTTDLLISLLRNAVLKVLLPVRLRRIP
jgi:hypothetical protein